MRQSITIETEKESYPVHIERDLLYNLKDYVKDYHRVIIISDDHVAKYYLDAVSKQCHNVDSFIIKAGEASKSYDNLEKILLKMEAINIQKSDLLLALGGGVVGDLAGFAASIYMRGIDYISIPTTTLSQIDSSVGGKVAIDFANTKNLIGNFYHPKMVLIDPNTLNTLDAKDYNCGLIEAVKMGLTSNKKLFELFLSESLDIEEIIYEAIKTKGDIVRTDEFDTKQRHILNFGHTLAHALEMKYKLYHGEAVYLGMLYEDISDEILQDLLRIGHRFNLMTDIELTEDLYDYMINDKKIIHGQINLVRVLEVGQGELISYPETYLKELVSDV